MYEQFFNFSTSPFKLIPSTDHYFAAEAIQGALLQTASCIQRASGPVTIIGPTGTGKTLLLQMLERQFREAFTVVNLGAARCERREDLLQAILFEIGEPFRQMPEGELRLGLMDFLRPSPKCENGILLLIDDAESLGNPLLDEVRLITNVVRNGQPRCRLVMAGGSRLEENLMNSKLESFNQRIAGRYYLENLSRDETRNYILTHIQRAGRDGAEIFAADTFRKISELTEGCPRLVNQLCENALSLAANLGRTQIDVEFIDYAWKDVQNIPTNAPQQPANPDQSVAVNEATESNSLVIEFGSLDDEPLHRSSETITTSMDSDEQKTESDSPSFGLESREQSSGQVEQAGSEDSERVDGGAIVLRRSATTTVFDVGSDNQEDDVNANGYDGVERRQRVSANRHETSDLKVNSSDLGSSELSDDDNYQPSIPVFDAATGEVFGRPPSQKQDELVSLEAGVDQELDVAVETRKANQELESDFESLGNQELVSDPKPVEKRLPGSLGIANQERLQHVLGGIFDSAENLPPVEDLTEPAIQDENNNVVDEATDNETAPSVNGGQEGFSNTRLSDGSIHLEVAEGSVEHAKRLIAEEESLAKQPAKNFDIVASIERGPKTEEAAANPFDESFESEEEVHNTVQPTFAQQNLSSLNVTRDQLQVLNSVQLPDEVHDSIPRETDASVPTIEEEIAEDKRAISAEGFAELLKSRQEKTVANSESEIRQPIALKTEADDHVSDAVQDPFAVQSWDVVATESGEDDHSGQAVVSSVEAISTFEATATSSFGEVDDRNGEPGFVVDRAYIERRADEVLRSLGELEKQCDQVEADGNANVISMEDSLAEKESLNQQASEYQAVERDGENIPEVPHAENGARGLEESAEILNQLNRDIASLQTDGETGSVIENLNVEYLSVDRTETGQSVDDRDMLVVSKVNEQPSERKNEFIPDPLASANPSQGRAERIDYKRLFEQLRDVSENP